jgi:hypothetical protein
MGDGNDDPVFDRFFVGLRRLWWLLLILGCAGGLVFRQADGAVSYTSTVTINVPENPALFELAGLKSAVPASLSDVVSYVGSPAFGSDVAGKLGGGVGVSATVDKGTPPTTVTIVITGPTRAVVDQASGPVVDAVLQRITVNVTATVAPIKAAVQASVARLNDRITQLDSQISTLDPSSALYQAVRSERIARADDLLNAANQAEVFQQYIDNVGGSAHRTVVPGSQAAAASSKRLVLGVMLGLFGALGVVALVSVVDHRTRVRSDVRPLAGGSFLGAVPTGFVGLGATMFALSVHEALLARGGGTPAFVCLDEFPELPLIADGVGGVLASSGNQSAPVVIDGLAAHPERLADVVGQGMPVVVVAVFGRTDRDAFNVLLEGLDRSSAGIAGWAFVGVPSRWATRAAS